METSLTGANERWGMVRLLYSLSRFQHQLTLYDLHVFTRSKIQNVVLFDEFPHLLTLNFKVIRNGKSVADQRNG